LYRYNTKRYAAAAAEVAAEMGVAVADLHGRDWPIVHFISLN
jgi:hypothetical protein